MAEDRFTLTRWRAALAVYADRRQLVILLMGFSSGLPLLLGFSTLSWWLKGEGVSLTAIGGLLTVSTPYAFKFLWAPVFDQVSPPPIFRRLGQRRGWLLSIQIPLMISIAVVGYSDPKEGLQFLAIAAVTMAFFSASQDVVIDAYRIEILWADDDEQAVGASSTQVGYRIGLLVAGAGAIALSDFIDWSVIYTAMGTLISVGVIATLIAPEPETRIFASEVFDDNSRRGMLDLPSRIIDRLNAAVLTPATEFFDRNWKAAIWATIFILFYKYGDAVAGAMSYPFFRELGFTGVETAAITKVFGICMAALGAIAGAVMVLKFGVIAGLALGGVLQAVTNLLFAYLATLGHDLIFLTVAIGADNFTGGLGSAAFVTLLSRFCNVSFTATQFALFTSLMALSRVLFAVPSGWLADQVGWMNFFILTTGLAVPALLLLFILARNYNDLVPKRPETEP